MDDVRPRAICAKSVRAGVQSGTISLARHESAGKGFDAGKLVKKVASPVGISVVVVLLVLIYAVFAFLPTLLDDPPPTTTALSVTSAPDGARVYVDGKDTGKVTPATITELNIDQTYALKLELRGHKPRIDEVRVTVDDVSKNQGRDIERRFILERATKTLAVKTDPPGAEVYIKGKYIGDTPLKGETIDGTTEETSLTIRMTGYRDRQVTVDWGDKTEHTVDEKLEKADK